MLIKIKNILLLIVIFILNSCSRSNVPLSCKDLSTNYSRYNSLEAIILYSAKEHNALAKYLFLYDETYKFNKNINTYLLYLELLEKKSIDSPRINKYCKNISFMVQKGNLANSTYSLSKLKKEWTKSYIDKIKNKIVYKEISGCEEFAISLENYIAKYRIKNNEIDTTEFIKRKNLYNSCLLRVE